MLRAQTLVTLKEYNSALFDVNQLIELDPSSEVYHNLQARLRTQVLILNHLLPHRFWESYYQNWSNNSVLSWLIFDILDARKALAPIPESEAELEEEEEEHEQPDTSEKEVRQDDKKEDLVVPGIGKDLNAAELNESPIKEKIIPSEKSEVKEYAEQETDCNNMPERNPGVTALQKPNEKDSKGYQAIPKPKEYSGQKNVPQRVGVADPLGEGIKDSKGWQAIPKPKGHSALDYARWDRVENDSSEDDDDDDDDEDSQPPYRFRAASNTLEMAAHISRRSSLILES
ncbi:hypothetical protein Goari_017799, partial [Gossypium aridum]|nr:hypothetical protein [Gossypium aridum]